MSQAKERGPLRTRTLVRLVAGTPEPAVVDGASPSERSWVEELVRSPLVAYGLMLTLQLRVVWGIWGNRDLTTGDTASYFLDAAGWASGLHLNILWSPLYTSFFGTILAIVGDAPTAVIVHRVVIVVAAALLVLALMRALLGPAIGLLVASWWAIVPANFEVDYEVHLFGFLPVLVAALLAFWIPGRTGRGIVLAVLLGTTILLRNELVIATAVFAAAALAAEIRDRRYGVIHRASLMRAYAIPLVVVALLTVAAFARSHVQGQELVDSSRAKHALNVCQIYAFNYQQRHPAEFVGNPFTDCAPLMERTFDDPMPTLTEAARANPAAVANYVAWNVRLLPAGLQVALFGATSTGQNPGYFPVEEHRIYALLLSAVMLLVLVAGGILIVRERGHWRRTWLRRREWALVVLGAAALTSVVVALTQRPRAEYMYALSVVLMGAAGLAAAALLRNFRVSRASIAGAAIAVPLVLCLVLPSHYKPSPRPLRDAVERLDTVRGILTRPGAVLVSSGYGFEACSYLAESFDRHCTSIGWPKVKEDVARGLPLGDALDQVQATVIYADESLAADPAAARLLAAPAVAGWRRVAGGEGTSGTWAVLVHRSQAQGGRGASAGGVPAALRRLPADLQTPGLRYTGIFPDAWMEARASVVLAGGPSGDLVLRAEVLPQARGQRVAVLVNGRRVAARSLAAGSNEVRAPIPAARGNRRVELRWAVAPRISENDPRHAAALLKFLAVPADDSGVAPDGTFEDGIDQWAAVDAGKRSLTAGRTSAEARFGGASLRLVNTAGAQDDYVVGVVKGVAPQATYRVAAWVHTAGMEAQAVRGRGLYVIARSLGRYLGPTEATASLAPGAGGWVRKTITVRTDLLTDELEIRLYAPRGIVFWDNISVERVRRGTPAPASQREIELAAALSAASAVPPPAVPSSGRGVFRAAVTGRTLRWSLSTSALTGPVVAAVLRNGPEGEIGERMVVLCEPCPAEARGTVVLTAPQARELLAGRVYVNAGTEASPYGEVRGQIARR
jgi:hypothetical protein